MEHYDEFEHMFKAHSWYFSNALVRANYRNVAKGIEPTTEYIQLFLRNLLLGEDNDLKNRYLHVRWQSVKPLNEVSEALKPQNDVSKKLPAGLSLKESAVLKAIMADSDSSIAQLAESTGLSTSTIDRVIKSLKDKQILSRTGSTKQVKWLINLP